MCRYVKSNSVVICRFSLSKPVCMETFDTLPQLGRFSIRDEGKTIAIGKVTKIISWVVCWELNQWRIIIMIWTLNGLRRK